MSTGVNVLRYSALAGGVFYGFFHQRTINSASRAAERQHEYDHRQQLISKAKDEFLKKNSPPAPQPAQGGVISDPSDPKFDLEAWINSVAGEAKS